MKDAKKLAKNEETTCSTCLKPIFWLIFGYPMHQYIGCTIQLPQRLKLKGFEIYFFTPLFQPTLFEMISIKIHLFLVFDEKR